MLRPRGLTAHSKSVPRRNTARRHAPEPFVEAHPADAGPLGVKEGALTRVQTAHGEAVALARLTDWQRRGGLFMPMHWTDAFVPSGKVNPLVGANRDPISGQPEFKHTPARLRPYREPWRGFLLSREALLVPKGLELIWRRTPQDACQLHEFAGRGDEAERDELRLRLTKTPPGELVSFEDAAVGAWREATVRHGRLERLTCITLTGDLPPRDWLAGLFGKAQLDRADRAALLIGRPAGMPADKGPLVCACLKVGANTIAAAIGQGAASVEAVGAATGAGTTCGSCRGEIGRMLAARIASSPENRHAG